MNELNSSSSVWLTGFWGFDPEEVGAMGFTDERDRDRLFQLIDKRQLVCIYGAASPETDRNIVHHLLGILEVERTPIDSWERMSEVAKKRNIELGRRNKWRFAMPVRRAWRTKHTLDVNQVFPHSYDPSKGQYIARFGTWLIPDEARWLLENVPFSQTNVFGEPPISDEIDANQTAPLSVFLKPSSGVFGSFGDRNFQIEDKPHNLYLAHFPSSPELLAGRRLEAGWGLVKIGISGDLKNRLKALNLSFPETTEISWKIIRKAQFPDRASAANAETAFKTRSVENYGAISLGREFFVMNLENANLLFNELSPVTGLDLRMKIMR
jgi:hypothetical protein